MPESRRTIERALKYTKYKQAKKRRENRERLKAKAADLDKWYPQSKLEDYNNDGETEDTEIS